MASELFGHAANYPTAGMPARPGIIGEAHGGTLFLDEIGELDHKLQSQLLRVMDGGEYHRLGESKAREANLRLVAATNRRRDELKHDLAARFPIVIEVGGLEERREDIPLLAQHLILELGKKDPSLTQPFLQTPPESTLPPRPRFALKLMSALVRHTYTTHARELSSALWDSVLESPGNTLELTPSVKRRLGLLTQAPIQDPGEPSEAELRRALKETKGVKEKAWRLLGLKNRFQLRRLMQKYGLEG